MASESSLWNVITKGVHFSNWVALSSSKTSLKTFFAFLCLLRLRRLLTMRGLKQEKN